ncbi:MAG: hypothetical protein HY040_29045 [Planctomycetes bacterium]|nr:hypothetical protein [Planctomycetota bacterium]
MNDIMMEQARYFREAASVPRLAGRSPGFREEWLHLAQKLVVGFGNAPAGGVCPAAVFAQPLGPDHVAVVQVADRGTQSAGRSNPTAPTLGFHLLIVEKSDYQSFLGDPFSLVRTFPADWNKQGGLEALSCPRDTMPPRTVADVQRVLSRIKAGALKEGDDPEAAHFVHTMENSESPALLGGAQVLVEGGKLVFERPGPDNKLLEGLWTLLPNSTRARLWPASFAFENSLKFDALVMPRLRRADFEGYTFEEQAADYPQGHYELALQIAAEAGNQRDLDGLLNRRGTGDTMRLAWALVIVVSLLALTPFILDWVFPKPDIVRIHKAAAAASIVGTHDPWTAMALKLHGDRLFFPPK